ncbi:hypothetical protein LTS08_008782 [Lithohypha guttulata]|nr:hypothetical protein LTS08_008782 [Lithohypha guttulata]
MSTSEKTSMKRRVPDGQRRRAQTSCDRCKKRRIKCTRNEGFNGSCKPCIDAGYHCESTLPRKKKIYGSAETLSLRYRALHALVKGIFANEDIDDTQTLFRLAQERQISMPQEDDASIATEAFGDAFSATSLTPDSCLLPELTTRWPSNIDQVVQKAVVNLREETCIPAPHGVAHYLGPASSFEFASAVRRLVAKRNKSTENGSVGHDRRSQLRTEFANLEVSIAMEPRIPEHPASTVRKEGNDKDSPETLSAQTTPQTTVGTNTTATNGSLSPYRRWVQSLLPSRQVTDSLVHAFFDKVHSDYALFHRGAFHTRYESIWHRTPSYTYEAEPGWLCCLFMVLVFGAQAREDHNLDDALDLQRRFLRFVRERFPHLSLTAGLANVQALLLLQLYEHNAGERNTSWILLGQAARMAIALGMHREGTSHNFDSIERNTRRMVWHTLYSFEQYAALSLGRPSTVKALEVNVTLPDEMIIDGGDRPQNYFKHASALLDLSSKIRHFATAASPDCFDQASLTSLSGSATALLTELEEWFEGLPQHLLPAWRFVDQKHQRAVGLLHIRYHHLSSVLTRPYLLYMIHANLDQRLDAVASEATVLDPTINSLGHYCIQSSLAVSKLLTQLSLSDVLQGATWTDFFYLYHAMLVLCLPFLGHHNAGIVGAPAVDDSSRLEVLNMISLCHKHRLSPTYHILSQVSIQFARIVGLAGDSPPSRDEQVGDSHAASTGRAINLGTGVGHDIVMPYAEPFSDLGHFSNDDMFLDFFNVSGVDDATIVTNHSVAHYSTPFSSLYGIGPIPSYGERWY